MSHPNYLGKHTVISHLTASEWKKIPYLKDNNGTLPPFVIAVGDDRRMDLACTLLKLQKVVRLHEQGERLLGLKARGRIAVMIGTYTHKGKAMPLVFFETQMGMPATEINAREIFLHCSPVYTFNKAQMAPGGIFAIRVGTAGGINDPADNAPAKQIAVGDIVNASFGIGWSGTLLEALGGLDYAAPGTTKKFRQRWLAAGHEFTHDHLFPKGQSSKVLVKRVTQAAAELKVKAFVGGNFSKDSLYAEMAEEAFIKLRQKYGVLSTEMEQMALLKVASDLKSFGLTIHTGLVSGVIGVLPGASFAEGRAVEKVEKSSLQVAARALWQICYQSCNAQRY